jgi:hypothetical protein
MEQKSCGIHQEPLRNDIYGTRCEDCWVDCHLYRHEKISAIRRRRMQELMRRPQASKKAG